MRSLYTTLILPFLYKYGVFYNNQCYKPSNPPWTTREHVDFWKWIILIHFPVKGGGYSGKRLNSNELLVLDKRPLTCEHCVCTKYKRKKYKNLSQKFDKVFLILQWFLDDHKSVNHGSSFGLSKFLCYRKAIHAQNDKLTHCRARHYRFRLDNALLDFSN